MTDASEVKPTGQELEQKLAQAYAAFNLALRAESDRGCALYAAAYIEFELMELLSACFVQHKDMAEHLFKGTTPLSSFSARTSMAYYLGLISSDLRAELDILRRIRNDFAHSNETVTFSTERVANRCSRLASSILDKGARPRDHFTSAASTILGLITRARVAAKAIPEKPREFFTEDQRDEHFSMVKAVAAKIAASAGFDLEGMAAGSPGDQPT